MKQMESRILGVRGHRVMLDADLAEIYGVTTKTLNQAVARNRRRFPGDFAFRLHHSETTRLRSQITISKAPRADITEMSAGRLRSAIASGRGRTARVRPWVFTDHGALMAANVLHSKRAIQVSVHVVRASVRLREMIAANKGLAKLLDELECRVSHHDEAITGIIKAIRELAAPAKPKPKRRIGFISED